MNESKVERLLTTKSKMVMLKSKDLQKGIDLKWWNSSNSETRYLSIEEKIRLLNLMKSNYVKFLEELIDWHLEGEQILSFTKGGCSLLPRNYQRFYDNCVAVETKNYELYINDKAIERCADIVFKLSERSKKDCFNFAKDKLESGKAKHLYISLNPYNNRIGRSTFFEDEDDDFVSGFIPINTVGYSSYPKEDGTYDEDDINNILMLIEVFTNARGLFEYGRSNETDLVMYNKGSMKIQAYNKDERIDEKVMSLLKKER